MDYYNEISEGYEELHREEQEKKIALIKQHIRPKKGEKLLDAGCGTGLTTRCWDCRRYGIDPSEKLVEKARQADRKGIYKIAPAESIPFEDSFFDIVISITAIQNFSDIEKGLKEIKRVGKGRFALSFLKKSPKAGKIKPLIRQMFGIKEEIEEDKDIIFLA